MIRELTDRRPALSALVIVLLFTAVPGAFLLAVSALFHGAMNGAATRLVFVYALVVEVLLLREVERPILIMIPFLMSLLGFIAAEIVYTVSFSMAKPGAGPSFLAFNVSSALIILFGLEAPAVIGALPVYGLLCLLRKVREALFS